MLHADGTLLQNNILLKQLFYWKKAFHPFRTFRTQRMHGVKAEGHLFSTEKKIGIFLKVYVVVLYTQQREQMDTKVSGFFFSKSRKGNKSVLFKTKRTRRGSKPILSGCS